MDQINTKGPFPFEFGKLELGLFRVAIGLLLLDFAIEVRPVEHLFYGSSGCALFDLAAINWLLPALAVMVISGALNPLPSFLAWIVLCELHTQQPHGLHAGDKLLRFMLFWSIFLPTNQKLSLHLFYFKYNEFFSRQVHQLATFGYILQVVWVYFFAALLKTGADWRVSGEALIYALSYGPTSNGNITQHILTLPVWLLKSIGRSVWYFELIGSTLLVLFYNAVYVRGILILLFIMFHLGIAFSMFLGSFPWICIAAFIPLFPFGIVVKKEQVLPSQVTYSMFSKAVLTVLAYAIVSTVAWNLFSLRGKQGMKEMSLWDPMYKIFHFDQGWSMYAPSPGRVFGQIEARAILVDERVVDILKTYSIDGRPPNDSFRWRRYTADLTLRSDWTQARDFSQFIVIDWNKSHSKSDQVKAMWLITHTYFVDEQYKVEQKSNVVLWMWKTD